MSAKRRKGLLVAAYVLLMVAVIAAFALFGLQLAQNRRMEADNEQLQEQIQAQSAQLEQLEGESARLERTLEEKQALLEKNEQQLALMQGRYAQVQAELHNALRYTLDVRKESAGTVIAIDQIDRENLEQYFTSDKIVEGDAVYQRIIGKSYVENDDIGLDELRYMKVLHYNFDHQVQVGELIVNRELVQDYLEIFQELFENEYEIYSMHLIDNYWTGEGLSSDSASIEVNNSSAFCYRRVAGGSGLSNHALGRAIDINPQQNPYVTFKDGKPQWTHDNADDYIDRDSGLPHVITHDDLLYKIFKEHGFDWGGDWNTLKDYQHFDKEE